MIEKGINIDNAFAALAEKKEEVHPEESTGTNYSNDKTSEVKSQREANKVHHHSLTKEWITNAFANYQVKGYGDTCSINRTTEQDNTEKIATRHSGELMEEQLVHNGQQAQGMIDVVLGEGERQLIIVLLKELAEADYQIPLQIVVPLVEESLSCAVVVVPRS